jgi:hypothetical protein
VIEVKGGSERGGKVRTTSKEGENERERERKREKESGNVPNKESENRGEGREWEEYRVRITVPESVLFHLLAGRLMVTVLFPVPMAISIVCTAFISVM